MNFDEFTKIIESAENPVVLLEGSRNVLDKDTASLSRLGIKLTERFPHVLFRSGGAVGSDNLFSQGVAQVNKNQMQIVLPKSRKAKSDEINNVCLDDLPDSELHNIFEITQKATPAYSSLVEFYKKKIKGKLYSKTQYLLRDTLKVCGSESLGISRANIGCFYVNSDKAGSGGTGHTIRVCRLLDVPVIEQTEWMKWI